MGRVVYDSISRIEIAYSNHIPLKAIDSINMSEEVPKRERIEIIGELIKNEEVRNLSPSETTVRESKLAHRRR